MRQLFLWRKKAKTIAPVVAPRPVLPTREAAAPAVLVVDDDYHVQQIIRLVLEGAGYDVLLARDASDTLAVIGATPGKIGLAVIDVNLPGMDGRHLATRIKAVSPRTNLLYVSGQPPEQLSEYGVMPDSWFLRKPFTHAELLERVSQRLAA